MKIKLKAYRVNKLLIELSSSLESRGLPYQNSEVPNKETLEWVAKAIGATRFEIEVIL